MLRLRIPPQARRWRPLQRLRRLRSERVVSEERFNSSCVRKRKRFGFRLKGPRNIKHYQDEVFKEREGKGSQLMVSSPSALCLRERGSLGELVAKFITNVGAPPFTFMAGAYVIGGVGSVNFSELLRHNLSIAHFVALCGGFLPLLLLAVLRSLKIIRSLDLETTGERVLGFGLAILFGLGGYLVLSGTLPGFHWLSNNGQFAKELEPFLLFLKAHIVATGLLFLLTVVTAPYGWKASIHTAGAGVLVFLSYVFAVPAVLLWGPVLVFGIAWSRWYLSCHKLSEIVVGGLLGFLVYWILYRSMAI
ncbi:MAG: phosphatase PAP2 family protein [Bdellovibrionales bacterium]|nr:phosphatase PAP2 family protein [Bdellovibrionales bacterium]